MRNVLVPSLKPSASSNTIEDYSSVLIENPIIRQIRVKKGKSCFSPSVIEEKNEA